MKSQSSPPNSRTHTFEEVLYDRLLKQGAWSKKYIDLPLIDDKSKTYKELCDGLIPQEDYFYEQLQDISSKFQGHYMTKQNKQLKLERDELEKEKIEMNVLIKNLQDSNVFKQTEIQKYHEDADTTQRKLKLQQALVDKLKVELEDTKQKNADINKEYKDYKEKEVHVEKTTIKQVLEKQIQIKQEEILQKDRIIKERYDENLRLSQELDKVKKELESERKVREMEKAKGDNMNKDVLSKNMIIKSLEKKIQDQLREQQEEIERKNRELRDYQKNSVEKEGQLNQYKKRTESTDQILTIAIEQESKYNELLKNYKMLETEWKSMENYINGLYEYQSHIESKYEKMLESFQMFIEQHQDEGSQRYEQQMSEEKENLYQNYLKVKDEEITLLKEEKQKKDQQILLLKKKEQEMDQQIEQLNNLITDAEQKGVENEQELVEELNRRGAIIEELEGQNKKLMNSQQSLSGLSKQEIEKREKELEELKKTRDLNQKLILQLEKQIKEEEQKNQKAKKLNVDKFKKDIENLQKQVEQKEKENEELRRMKIIENKEVQQLLRENEELKESLSMVEKDNLMLEEDKKEQQFLIKEVDEMTQRLELALNQLKNYISVQSQQATPRKHKFQNIPSTEVEDVDEQQQQEEEDMYKSVNQQMKEQLDRLASMFQLIQQIQIQYEEQVLQLSKFVNNNEEGVLDNETQQRCSEKLKHLLNDQQQEEFQCFEEVVDKVVVHYELLQEENKLLMQEREFYYDQKVKKLAKESDDLKTENYKLKELIKSLQLQEQSKIQELERSLLERSQLEGNEIVQLQDKNEKMIEQIQVFSQEVGKLSYELDQQAELNEKLQKENLYLKKKYGGSQQQQKQQSQSPPSNKTQNINSSNNFKKPGELSPDKISASNSDNNFYKLPKQSPTTKKIEELIEEHRKKQKHTVVAQKESPQKQNNQSQLVQKNNQTKNLKFENQREEENEKLNQLIEEYKRENERCSQKISELQEKLHLTSHKFQKEKEEEHHQRARPYSDIHLINKSTSAPGEVKIGSGNIGQSSHHQQKNSISNQSQLTSTDYHPQRLLRPNTNQKVSHNNNNYSQNLLTSQYPEKETESQQQISMQGRFNKKSASPNQMLYNQFQQDSPNSYNGGGTFNMSANFGYGSSMKINQDKKFENLQQQQQQQRKQGGYGDQQLKQLKGIQTGGGSINSYQYGNNNGAKFQR